MSLRECTRRLGIVGLYVMITVDHARTPLSAALVDRRIGGVLCRAQNQLVKKSGPTVYKPD
jgi:hypothetical protein